MTNKQIAEKLGVSEEKVAQIRQSLENNQDIRENKGIMPKLRSDIMKLEDLSIGDKVTGIVRNITDFGAFVDIGIHMDGLVHKSKISTKFVKNPREYLKIGQAVEVTVVDIDHNRNRLSLSMID